MLTREEHACAYEKPTPARPLRMPSSPSAAVTYTGALVDGAYSGRGTLVQRARNGSITSVYANGRATSQLGHAAAGMRADSRAGTGAGEAS